MKARRPNTAHIIRNKLIGLTSKADLQLSTLASVTGRDETEVIRMAIDEKFNREITQRFNAAEPEVTQ